MPDLPGDASTTAVLTLGGSWLGDLTPNSDISDWYRVTLTAGQTYYFSMFGYGFDDVIDTYLYLRNAAGTLIASNDDGGPNRYSAFSYTATSTGTYYVDAQMWNNFDGGSYLVSMSPVVTSGVATGLPVFNYDQIANQLINGFWAGQYELGFTPEAARAFVVGADNSISVNITALTGDGQTLAIAALQVWADVLGIGFSFVSSGAEITFDDNQSGAFENDVRSGNQILSANVNVSTAWLSSNGTGLNSYSYQTYIHEIGHALGLGHGGIYNGSASYPGNAYYANDSWQATIMSYMDQDNDNTYVNASFAYVMTPQLADILAVSYLYGGLSGSTRPGNTTYGFNTNTTNAIYNFATIGAPVSLTLYDTGGNDTLDLSGYSSVQSIDLRPGAISSVGGDTGNLMIYFNTIIENAVGGTNIDTIHGNDYGNVIQGFGGADSLWGHGAADRFHYGSIGEGAAGEVINDFSGAELDMISLSRTGFGLGASGSLAAAGIAFVSGFSPAATTGAPTLLHSTTTNGLWWDSNGTGAGGITFLGTISGVTAGVSAASTPSGAGWQVVGTGNYNGTGALDLLWKNVSNGATGAWLMVNGTLSSTPGYYNAAGWDVIAQGDYNGDGRTDIMWRNAANGTTAAWLMGASGVSATPTFGVTAGWAVIGQGDFDGNGRTDILWRNASGTTGIWYMNNGGPASTPTIGSTAGWDALATADFNGDGRQDILWRSTGGQTGIWFMAANGTIANAPIYGDTTGWEFLGRGDLNGDGRADILWRNTASGMTGSWLMNASGGIAATTFYYGSTGWSVVGIADMDNNGSGDILWRNNTDGTIAEWMMTGGVASYTANLPYGTYGWSAVGVGDFNGDGNMDVMWQNNTTGATALWQMAHLSATDFLVV